MIKLIVMKTGKIVEITKKSRKERSENIRKRKKN